MKTKSGSRVRRQRGSCRELIEGPGVSLGLNRSRAVVREGHKRSKRCCGSEAKAGEGLRYKTTESPLGNERKMREKKVRNEVEILRHRNDLVMAAVGLDFCRNSSWLEARAGDGFKFRVLKIKGGL